MAHEISVVNGRAEAFYALKPAWHGLGTVLDFAPDSATAMESAHLNWNVRLDKLRTVEGVDVPEHFATVREDTADVLGVVSRKYAVVQNRDAFDFLDGLLQDGVLKYESAGALKGGRTVWALARMPGFDTIADGDDSARYVLFTTSHDGTGAIHAIPTAVRVVCNNTLRIATAGLKGIRHTGDVDAKLRYARQYLSQFDKAFTLYRDNARLLASRELAADKAKDYIAKLFPEVPELGRARTIRENAVNQIRRNYRAPRQQLDSIKDTWWSLYNSVSEYIDHQSNWRGATAHDRAENRMISNMDGTGADFKSEAFDVALAMSA
jgi:phage/plasmid-like protein (TIGR03299 family)